MQAWTTPEITLFAALEEARQQLTDQQRRHAQEMAHLTGLVPQIHAEFKDSGIRKARCR